jgi:hypothetical protein
LPCQTFQQPGDLVSALVAEWLPEIVIVRCGTPSQSRVILAAKNIEPAADVALA